MRRHKVVHLKGMGPKPAGLLVVAVAPAFEVAGRLKVGDYGFDASAPRGAEDTEDALFVDVHVRFVLNIYQMIRGFLQIYSRIISLSIRGI